jgi:hypothetical protein
LREFARVLAAAEIAFHPGFQMQRSLFGVAIPDGAVRVVIRPVLGRGGAQPLYEGPLSVDSIPTDNDVTVSASRNVAFWEYIDQEVKRKRIEAPADGWEWKLRLQFYSQTNAEEPVTTEGVFPFYRSGAASKGEEGGSEAKLIALFERGMGVLQEMGKQQAKALRKAAKANAKALAQISAAATTAIGEVGKAAAGAVAEASKQTAVVSEITKTLHTETVELKEGIFELQTEMRNAPKQAPKSTAEQLKDVVDTVNTFRGLADSFGSNSSQKPPEPAPAPGSSGAKDD